jgi:CRP/FNR family cyclic AMP-dependent transcriptional regulator
MSQINLIGKFLEPSGKARLAEYLRKQQMVAQNKSVAEGLAKYADVRELSAGETLVAQGDNDSDIYFILEGSLKIIANNQEIAEREAGQHVGEMCLVNPALARSASNVAAKPTVVAKVSEAAFSKIANEHPQLWRAIAIELTERLDTLQRRDRTI